MSVSVSSRGYCRYGGAGIEPTKCPSQEKISKLKDFVPPGMVGALGFPGAEEGGSDNDSGDGSGGDSIRNSSDSRDADDEDLLKQIRYCKF